VILRSGGGLVSPEAERNSAKAETAMSGTGEHGPDTPQSFFPYSRALVILQR